MAGATPGTHYVRHPGRGRCDTWDTRRTTPGTRQVRHLEQGTSAGGARLRLPRSRVAARHACVRHMPTTVGKDALVQRRGPRPARSFVARGQRARPRVRGEDVGDRVLHGTTRRAGQEPREEQPTWADDEGPTGTRNRGNAVHRPLLSRSRSRSATGLVAGDGQGPRGDAALTEARRARRSPGAAPPSPDGAAGSRCHRRSPGWGDRRRRPSRRCPPPRGGATGASARRYRGR